MRAALVLLFGVGSLVAACGDAIPPSATPPSPAPSLAPIAVPPPPPDPAPTTDGDVTVAWSHGMEISVKHTPGTEFVAAQLYIRGGTRNWTADDAGIENVALDVATHGGTQALAKGPFSRRLASLGARIQGFSGNDFATITTKAPTASWDELFPLFADTFLAPALPPSEFAIVKQRELSDRRHEMEDGDGRLWLLARKTVFAGHPYANRPVGTVETISALKAEDLAPYLAKLHDTNRLVLIVVGDVDPAHVIDQVKRAFASVLRGDYRETPIPQLHFTGSHLAGDAFKLPTNYIQSMFAGPSWQDPDFIPMWLGMDLLGHRVQDEVRTKRNLSYAPEAYFDFTLAAPFGVLYVTAVDPNATMTVMMSEARRLQTEIIPAKELDGAKSVFLTGYLEAHETTDGQAYLLGTTLMLGGDWHLANTLADRFRATTPEAVRDAAAKWISNVQTAIVGDPTKLDPKVVGAQ